MKRNMFGSLVIAAALAATASGCVVRGHANARFIAPAPVAVIEVEEEPPPPRTVVVETRSGFLWIEGRWVRNSGRWDWRDGYWERERSNQRWEQGRWERRGNRHIWVDGRWSAGGGAGPTVRDHRNQAPPPRERDSGPTVRDHRH